MFYFEVGIFSPKLTFLQFLGVILRRLINKGPDRIIANANRVTVNEHIYFRPYQISATVVL